MTATVQQIKEFILQTVERTKGRITPLDMEKEVLSRFGIKRREARAVIRESVDENLLTYTSGCGRIFLDISLNRPYPLSENVVIKPAAISFSDPDKRVIGLVGGMSFGNGAHDTTRLCVRAIDRVLSKEAPETLRDKTALDIGTGSGILAITAASFGVGQVHASDRDPIAVNEAKANVAANNMEKQVFVHGSGCGTAADLYDYLIANLRYPTLMDLHDAFRTMLKKNGTLILSGIKKGEEGIVLEKYRDGFHGEEITFSGEWVGIVLTRTE